MSDPGQISDFRTLLSTLSPDALTRGKQFERITKWWLENDPVHSRQIEKVWLWDEWPEYPGRDTGIDLVARLLDGSLMAVQAKCVDESRSIPKSELDSFVSAASSSSFKHKMLVATTDGLSANAQRMLADQHVVRVMLSDLETSVDVWPSSIDHLDQHPVQPKATPRPHQQQAISNVTTGMSDHDRGQLIMACGTGKTLTALWITEQLKPAVTLVLVPSLNLLSQTLSEWSKNTTADWSYLCVCSDDTVNKSDDQPISTVDELPFEVTTNPDDIANFLKHPGTRIIFSTYQSSARVAQAQQLTGTTFNLVICDEAHRLTGKTDADYATVLDNSKIVADKRLFMTATPRTYTPAAKSKAEDRGVDITSMDDETVYGPVLHKLSFGDAIKQDLLSDYRVLIVGVTDPQVQELIDRREIVSVNDTVTTDARTLAAHIGLAKATKDYNLKRTISFHSRIKSADQFAQDHIKILDWLPDTHKPEGTTWTGTISGAMNTGERRRLLTQLKQDDQDRHALLTNARCLTEGVDVPSLDGVAFIDPRSSQVDIIQAVGRAIRKSANKEIGTIVLPVLIPTDADAEHALEDTAFKPIWAILNALKSHDEELAVELNALRTELGRTGKVGQLPDRLVEDLPIDIDSLLPGFLNKLSIAILERITERWEWWYGQIQTYAEENGDCLVPIHTYQGPYNLGMWVSNQRTLYQRGELDQEKIGRLESLKKWSWDVLADTWQQNYEEFVNYVAVNGTAQISNSISDYQLLRSWTAIQRSRYKTGKLDPKKIALLETVSGWKWNPDEEFWQQHFDLLVRFVEANGSATPTRDLIFDGRNLGSWCSNQRTKFKARKLPLDKVALLEALPGWAWDTNIAAWERSFEALVRYINEYGTAAPPKSYVMDGLQLGSWVSRQRVLFNRNLLEQDKLARFEALPGWSWDPSVEAWEKAFEALSKYAIEHKTATPPRTFVVGELKLGSWVGTQRQKYRKGNIDPQRLVRLEALPGWAWDTNIAVWERSFEALARYTEEFGIARPPQGLEVDGLQLGSWVVTQRNLFNTHRLPQDKTIKLESLNGWSWHTLNDSWKKYFDVILRYSKRMGDSNVPQGHVEENLKLGTWVHSQRQRYSKNKLETSRIEQLAALPKWSWDPINDSWNRSFELLNKYAEEFGHSRVPQNSSYQEVRLGTWVNKQRGAYRKGRLDGRQIELLESMPNWVWNPFEEDWEMQFSLLVDFLQREGHIQVAPGFHNEGENLDRWINNQRAQYSRGRLNPEQIMRLEKLPNWKWNLRQHSWEQYFALLEEFVKEFGHSRVSQNYSINEVRLGTWVNKQRGFQKRGSLSKERCELLESMPGWIWTIRK